MAELRKNMPCIKTNMNKQFILIFSIPNTEKILI